MPSWYCCECGHASGEHHECNVHTSPSSLEHGTIAKDESYMHCAATPFYQQSHYYGYNSTDIQFQKSEVTDLDHDDSAVGWGYLDKYWVYAEPIVELTCFAIGSMSALDVGDYAEPWINAPWELFDCSHPAQLGGLHDSRSASSCTRRTIATSIAYTAAVTTLHHLNRRDIHQDRCLFAGITSGICIGLYMGKTLEGTIFEVLPFTILCAMLCSMMWHVYLRHMLRIRRDGMQVLQCHDEKQVYTTYTDS